MLNDSWYGVMFRCVSTIEGGSEGGEVDHRGLLKHAPEQESIRWEDD